MVSRSRAMVGVVGSGQIGRAPFDRRSWSGSSYYFFTELMKQGGLHRAFGVEAAPLARYLLLARNFYPRVWPWHNRLYLDTRYREALTQAIGRQIKPDDRDHDFLQIGAFYNVPSLIQDTQACYSYNDGNLASRLRAPFPLVGVSSRSIDRTLKYEENVASGMQLVFTMSEYLRHSFISDYGIDPSRVICIHAGVNLDSIPVFRPQKNYETREILFIGVDFDRKGGRELLSAFQHVRSKFSDATLHIVGPKSVDIPPRLRTGVVLHGYVERSSSKMTELFDRCTLFAMPSLYEPFGIAPLEAMLNQLPAILTDQWALREMVVPGETGELVACGSIDDLQAKLVTMLQTPDGLRRMGQKARESVLARYTWPTVINNLLGSISNVGRVGRSSR